MNQQSLPFEFKGSKDEIYVCETLIGSGSEGKVYRGTRKDQSSLHFAIKFQYSARKDELQFLHQLQKNIDKFKHIIKYYDVIENPKFLYNQDLEKGDIYCFVMELGEKNLLEAVIGKSNYTDKQKIEIIYQIALGIQELHSIKHIHRDIKPENIIIIGNDWKLCDFGFLKHQISQIKTQNVGTPYYIAPEVNSQANQNSYDQKIDIWSFGCLIYEIITNRLFFDGNTPQDVEQKILTYISQQMYNPLHANSDERFKSITNLKLQQLCKCMLTVKPQDRYDINQVMQELQQIVQQLNQPQFQQNLKFPINPPQNFPQLQNNAQQLNQYRSTQNYSNPNDNKLQVVQPRVPTVGQVIGNSFQQQYKNPNQTQQNSQFLNKQFAQLTPNFSMTNPLNQNPDKNETNQELKQNENQQVQLQQKAKQYLDKTVSKVARSEKKNELLSYFDKQNIEILTGFANQSDTPENIRNATEVLALYVKERVYNNLKEKNVIK